MEHAPEKTPLVEEKKDKKPHKTQAEQLLEIFQEVAWQCFRDDLKEPYVAIAVGEHTEILPIRSEDFETYLSGLYYKATSKAISRESVKQAATALAAMALHSTKPPVPLKVRLAGDSGEIWYDLTDPRWQAVQVWPGGWAIDKEPHLLFRRYRHQTPQRPPTQGGSLHKILDYVNVAGNETLFLCWLVSCFVPDIPHPMPIFYGEQGAAKSTTCGMLKQLIDPSALETLTLPNDQRALTVNMKQHYFLPFDNVSHITEETSDTLCRAITGSGIQQRRLYTNDDDVVFCFLRCFALNGINNVATRPDLLDRSILIELSRIPEEERRELSAVKAAFSEDRGEILGGIFDILAQAMVLYPDVQLSKLPRMADFTRWGYAIGEAMGGHGEEFLQQYKENREAQTTEALHSDPVAMLVVELMMERPLWEGTFSDLLSLLKLMAANAGMSSFSKSLPGHANLLSKRLRSLKSNLEAAGIWYTSGRDMHGTRVTLKSENSSTSSTYRHKPSNINGLEHDDDMTMAGRGFVQVELPLPWDEL